MHIDWWTLTLQAINLLILAWILARFLYRPVTAVIEQRRAAAAKVLADATVMRSAAEAEKADIAAARAGFAAERNKLLADARKEIAEERESMLREAAQRIEMLRAENAALLARERVAMEQALARKASALAVQIAQRLLERLPPDAARAVFLDALLAQIAALTPQNRELLVNSARNGAFQIATASALTEVQKQAYQNAIESALGAKATLIFTADPRLIAGLELSTGAMVLKNNWQADLSQILEQLNSDDGQR